MKKTSMDMTEGSILRLIAVFSFPLLMGQLFQNLYNSVDSIIVGQFVGITALAAVTSCSDISMLLVGFFNGLSVGAGVLFSRYFGAKNNDLLHRSIHTAIAFCLLLGVAMTAAGILLTPQLLRLVDCPPDVYGQASAYLRIYFVGVLFTSLYNVGSGVLRAVGDSRSPFIYLVISSVTNIALDLIFVVLLRLDVYGVAIATVIAQMCSVALVFRRLMRAQDVYRLELRDLRIDKKILVQVVSLGLPTAIQSAIISSSNLFVQRYVNAFGSSAMAGIGVGKKVDKFLMMISQALGWTSTTFVSQNLGAGKRGRVSAGIRTCVLLGAAAMLAIGIPIYIFAPMVVRLFTKNISAVSYGVDMVRVMSPFYIVNMLNTVFAGAIRGYGKSQAVMISSIMGMVVMRQIFLAISMSINHSVVNVYYGFPLGWACSMVLTVGYYFLMLKKERRTTLQAPAAGG